MYVGEHIQHSARQSTFLLWPSLAACTQPEGQPEVRAESLLRFFLRKHIALSMHTAPRGHMSELSKASHGHLTAQLLIKTFGEHILYPKC